MAGFDFLNGPDVQIHQFGQLFLRDFFSHPLSAEIRAECFKLRGLFGVQRHTPH